jgi:DNA polymerase-1
VFGGDRAKAKLGLLGAMYGQTSGEVGPLLVTLRRRFPRAIALVDDAAKAGIEGRVVHTRLGRACPPPSARWLRLVGGADGEAKADQVRHDRGRFTRNFVVQGSAAEWALALIATLRQKLAGTSAELVFFLHDEVVLHCEQADAERVRDGGDRVRRWRPRGWCSARARCASRCTWPRSSAMPMRSRNSGGAVRSASS